MGEPKLTKLELQIMEALWTRAHASIREIQETFPERDRPAYTTIQTTVYRLERKKVVRRVKKVGNFHLWLANCYFTHDSSGFPVLLPFFDAPSGGSFIHFLATLVRLLGPGGVRSIVAESLLLKHQLLLLTRCVLGGCALRGSDRFSSTVSIRQTGCLHPDQHILNATQNSLCRVVDRRRGRCACRARKCRSVTIMARILAEKTESSFAPSHSFRRCTRFWRGTPVFVTRREKTILSSCPGA